MEIKLVCGKIALIDECDLHLLEDRNSMVKKWRELGLICLQVVDGNF